MGSALLCDASWVLAFVYQNGTQREEDEGTDCRRCSGWQPKEQEGMKVVSGWRGVARC